MVGLNNSSRSANAATERHHLLALGNLKGGTGKSTIAVNLACTLAELGRSVMVVDNDLQGTAAAWAAQGKLPISCVHMPLDTFAQVEPWIRAVQDLRQRYDVVVVDLPATVAPALAASFLMATIILVPTSLSQIDLLATRRMLSRIERARQERADHPPSVLIVPDRVEEHELGLDSVVERLAVLGELVAAPLRRSAVFDLAFDQGEWVGSLQPGGPSHRELLVLAQRVLERLEAMQPSPWVQADEPERGADPSDPSDHARRPIFVETWRIRADLTRPSRWFDRLLGLFSRSRTTAGTIAT